MSTLVMKFGGSSTGSAGALNRAADIVYAVIDQWDQILVVVSAMQGMTDMLLECAEQAQGEDRGQWQNSLDELHRKLLPFASEAPLLELIEARMAELNHACQHIHHAGVASPPEIAHIAAFGERINMHVFSAALQARGLRSAPVDAADLIVTDDCFQSASPIKSLTDQRINTRLSPILAEGIIPVVTGFIGATISGETTTLGRGGSDYTAAILAASLGADEIWIWTDVDGVMTADPGLIPGALLIPEISYNEVFQLAYSGAKVLHPKTILPAQERNIPILVKNTFNPQCSGTRISHCSSSAGQTISAVTGHFYIKAITLEIKPGENISKIKSTLLAALKNQGTPALAVFQANHDRSVSFAIYANDADRVIQTIKEFSAFSQLRVNGSLSLITLVGRDIYLSPQVMPAVSNTLEKSGVAIKRIGNGNSPDSLVFAVEDQAGRKAIQQIHDHVILNGKSMVSQTQPVLRQQPAF
jgi:aspartate kinase